MPSEQISLIISVLAGLTAFYSVFTQQRNARREIARKMDELYADLRNDFYRLSSVTFGLENLLREILQQNLELNGRYSTRWLELTAELNRLRVKYEPGEKK